MLIYINEVSQNTPPARYFKFRTPASPLFVLSHFLSTLSLVLTHSVFPLLLEQFPDCLSLLRIMSSASLVPDHMNEVKAKQTRAQIGRDSPSGLRSKLSERSLNVNNEWTPPRSNKTKKVSFLDVSKASDLSMVTVSMKENVSSPSFDGHATPQACQDHSPQRNKIVDWNRSPNVSAIQHVDDSSILNSSSHLSMIVIPQNDDSVVDSSILCSAFSQITLVSHDESSLGNHVAQGSSTSERPHPPPSIQPSRQVVMSRTPLPATILASAATNTPHQNDPHPQNKSWMHRTPLSHKTVQDTGLPSSPTTSPSSHYRDPFHPLNFSLYNLLGDENRAHYAASTVTAHNSSSTTSMSFSSSSSSSLVWTTKSYSESPTSGCSQLSGGSLFPGLSQRAKEEMEAFEAMDHHHLKLDFDSVDVGTFSVSGNSDGHTPTSPTSWLDYVLLEERSSPMAFGRHRPTTNDADNHPSCGVTPLDSIQRNDVDSDQVDLKEMSTILEVFDVCNIANDDVLSECNGDESCIHSMMGTLEHHLCSPTPLSLMVQCSQSFSPIDKQVSSRMKSASLAPASPMKSANLAPAMDDNLQSAASTQVDSLVAVTTSCSDSENDSGKEHDDRDDTKREDGTLSASRTQCLVLWGCVFLFVIFKVHQKSLRW